LSRPVINQLEHHLKRMFIKFDQDYYHPWWFDLAERLHLHSVGRAANPAPG
jgi:hypothetical protein